MILLLGKRYHQTIKRTHRHYDCQRQGRVDRRGDSIHQRFGRFGRNDAVGRFTSGAISGFIRRRNWLLL